MSDDNRLHDPEAKSATHRGPSAPRVRHGKLSLIETSGFPGYQLLDSGHGRKLERFGRFTVDRPEPQALWRQSLPPETWLRADAAFKPDRNDEESQGGRWRYVRDVPKSWPVEVMGVTALCRLMSFFHLGIFPEQLPHWAWMLERLSEVKRERPRVLNLFAYTGVASLIAARSGAEVTHVDASKRAIQWAKENQSASGLQEAPLRWIVDDARKFVAREVRRGRSYHVILIDPPKFGRGPEGEVWDLFTDLPALMRDCAQLLAPGRAAMALSVYAIRASALAFDQLARENLRDRGGVLESGELAIRPEKGGPAVPASLFVRWQG
jgi:23S rRNA (cytosine1962-C5)-methyltransferase